MFGEKEMGKLEKKIEIVRQYLSRCNSLYTCYTYGNIPRDKFRNACSSYAGHVEYEKALGLIDETVFGSAKKGMLFTESGLYASGIGHIMKYSDGANFQSLPDSYNLTAINELLDKLREVENAPTGWDIAGSLIRGVFDVVSTLAEMDDTETDNTSHVAIEDNSIIDVEEDIIDDDVVMDDSDDDTFDELLSSAQLWLEEIENNMSDVLVSEENTLFENLEEILDLLDDEDSYTIEKFLDECFESLVEDGNFPNIKQTNLTKNSRRIVNKIKYCISVMEDSDDSEEIASEISETKKLFRNYVKILNEVSDNLEEVVN